MEKRNRTGFVPNLHFPTLDMTLTGEIFYEFRMLACSLEFRIPEHPPGKGNVIVEGCSLVARHGVRGGGVIPILMVFFSKLYAQYRARALTNTKTNIKNQHTKTNTRTKKNHPNAPHRTHPLVSPPRLAVDSLVESYRSVSSIGCCSRVRDSLLR